MNKYEVLKTIKEINSIIENQKDKTMADPTVEMLLDCITIENPCWKYYNQFQLKLNHKTMKYYVIFND